MQLATAAATASAIPRRVNRIMDLFPWWRRVVRVCGGLLRPHLVVLDFRAYLLGGSPFSQMPISDQLKKHRHEKNSQECGCQHAPHDARADCGAGAGAGS